jgi:hypothetical protein
VSVAEILVRVAVSTLPALARERYREEWRADLAGASDAGISPRSVAVGAIATAITLDRDLPAWTGFDRRALSWRRFRWALAFLTTSTVLLAGSYFGGGYATEGVDEGAVVVGALLGAAGTAVGLLGVAAGVVGMLLVTAAARARVRRARLAFSVAAASGAALFAWAALSYSWALLVLWVPLALLAPFAAVALVVVTPERRPGRRRALLGAVPGAAALAGFGALGTVHTLVWNPVARVPELALTEIHAAMRSAGELPSSLPVFIWAALCGVGAAAILSLPLLRRPIGLRRTATASLLAIGVAQIGLFAVSFPWGMGLADTFATTGGDAAVTGPLLMLISQLALAAGSFLAFAPEIGADADPGAAAESATPVSPSV